MKIWIDICSPPHVHLSKVLADKLESKGHEVVITTRNFYNLKSLLEEKNMDYKVVGKHAGRNKIKKFFNGITRINELKRFIDKENIDIFVGKHSTEGPIVSGLKGKKSISMVDSFSPQNLFMFGFSDISLVPETFHDKTLALARKTVRFKGVFEYSYCKNFKPNKKVLDDLGLNKNDKIVISRSEPFLASHTKNHTNILNTLERLKSEKIVFFPRDEKEEEKARKKGFIVPEKAVDLLSLYSFSNLTISAGSTINREACLCGCPTISVYPGRLPPPDVFLIKKGLIHHNIHNFIEKGNEILEKNEKNVIKGLDMEDPVEKISNMVKK